MSFPLAIVAINDRHRKVSNGNCYFAGGSGVSMYGNVSVIYEHHVAIVIFHGLIARASSEDNMFDWGIDAQSIPYIYNEYASDISPLKITPVQGGTWTCFDGATGGPKYSILGLSQSFMSSSDRYWAFGRIYDASGNGSFGVWPPSAFAKDDRIMGICYGVY